MKVVIDDNIPYIKGVFEQFCDVVYAPGAIIDANMVADADALIIRTRTQCDEKLLFSSNLKFIASATIGYDHIDVNYCRKKNIQYFTAAGCNSSSVQQYLASALCQLTKLHQLKWNECCLGIVGVGNVGAKVSELAQIMGFKILLCDPIRAQKETSIPFVGLDEIAAKADLISFHVPLTKEGPFATYGMANDRFFKLLKKQAIIINSSRGEVIQTHAIKSAIDQKLVKNAVIDCWESEPFIDCQLLEKVSIATAHIAGYSRDGKANATTMVVREMSKFFNLGINDWEVKELESDNHIRKFDGIDKNVQDQVGEVLLNIYPIMEDDQLLRQNLDKFEYLRSNYRIRREYPFYTLELVNFHDESVKILQKMNFKIILK